MVRLWCFIYNIADILIFIIFNFYLGQTKRYLISHVYLIICIFIQLIFFVFEWKTGKTSVFVFDN